MDAEMILGYIQTNPLLIGTAIFALLAAGQIIFLSLRLERLLKGGNGKSLESTIMALQEKVKTLEGHASATDQTLADVNRRLRRSVQGVSVKRFDPFGTGGGQQSFATALLNEEGSGVVVSGIHARDGVRVYAKEVAEFKSERELSEEEAGAIEEAQKKVN